jgi:hypothetical protein
MKLLVYVSFSLGFWILVTASYNEQHYDYYIEHLYKPISFFTILMFTDEFIQEVKNKNIVVVCLLLISIVSLAKIRHGRHVFQQKLQKIEKILDVMSKHHIDKAYFHNDNFRPMLNDDRWNMVVESLLYSACKRKEQSKTFEVTYDTKAVRDFIHNDNTIFFQEGTKMPLIQLNSDYYSLSNSNYIQIDSLLNKNE